MSAYSQRYPRQTLQYCSLCGEPTERCKEDSLWLDDERGPVCLDCLHREEPTP